MRHEEFPSAENLDSKGSLNAHIESILSKNKAAILAASERAEQILKKEASDPREFWDVVPAEQIEADIKKTEARRSTFKENRTDLDKLAFSTEVLLYEQIGISGWLAAEGIQTFVEKSSDPDDVLRGTDLVVVFDAGEGLEPLALSVDLTIGGGTLSNKVRGIKKGIDEGTLAEIRYHSDPDGTHHPLKETPKVFVGITAERAASLARLWVSDNKQDLARLKDHPIQLSIVRQIEMQLTSYENYARSGGRPGLADRFAGAKALVKKVLAEKEKNPVEDPTLAAEDSLLDVGVALRTQLIESASLEKPYESNNTASKYRWTRPSS